MTGASVGPSRGGATLLVVEDDPRQLEALGYLFEAGGWNVATARAGNRGLAIALQLRPDVVVTDLQLPGLSGLELARGLSAAGPPAIPVIAITAAGLETRNACEESGLFCLVLEKPVEASELLDAVSRSLQDRP